MENAKLKSLDDLLSIPVNDFSYLVPVSDAKLL